MTDSLDRLATALADRYTIERELGAGGMATVYLAHDVRHDRHVALKVLRPELSAILGAGRFLAEIKTTANLQHPHILSLYDSGEADGLVFYVMPYVEGESLRDRLTREHQLPVEDALRLTKEVAAALAKRSAGSFSSAVSTAASTCGGMVCRCGTNGRGVSVTTRATTACAVEPVKGGSPVSIS